ncbi:hypothetical protein N7540_005576 [Penicillium herquei]|nr:hypothetical protein N7540_005576 [Penicillium herquei]
MDHQIYLGQFPAILTLTDSEGYFANPSPWLRKACTEGFQWLQPDAPIPAAYVYLVMIRQSPYHTLETDFGRSFRKVLCQQYESQSGHNDYWYLTRLALAMHNKALIPCDMLKEDYQLEGQIALGISRDQDGNPYQEVAPHGLEPIYCNDGRPSGKWVMRLSTPSFQSISKGGTLMELHELLHSVVY